MPTPASIVCDRNVPAPMRDGSVLYADLYRPAGRGGIPSFSSAPPTATMVSPRSRSRGREGYVVVPGHARAVAIGGRFQRLHERARRRFRHLRLDTEQPWSNGRIGMVGGSYVGATQWQAALAGRPVCKRSSRTSPRPITTRAGAIRAARSSWSFEDLGTRPGHQQRRSDRGGEPGAGVEKERLDDRIDHTDADFDIMPLPGDPLLAEVAPYYEEWLAHPDDGRSGTSTRSTAITARSTCRCSTPAAGTTSFSAARSPTSGDEGGRKNRDGAQSGPSADRAVEPHIGRQTPDRQVRPGRSGHAARGRSRRPLPPLLRPPPARHRQRSRRGAAGSIFMMGHNRWHLEHEWPLARRVHVEFFFLPAETRTRATATAHSPETPGDGSRPDHFVYDPLNPVPTQGRRALLRRLSNPGGQYDQSESRCGRTCSATRRAAGDRWR